MIFLRQVTQIFTQNTEIFTLCYVTATNYKTTGNKLLTRARFYLETANITSYNNDEVHNTVHL